MEICVLSYDLSVVFALSMYGYIYLSSNYALERTFAARKSLNAALDNSCLAFFVNILVRCYGIRVDP